jgi:hypothetical protein
MKYILKGKAVWISKAPAPAGVAITGITKAKPAVLTMVNTAKAGDYVRIAGTGFASLDGKAFKVLAATGTSITLDNSDSTVETGTFVANASALGFVYDAVASLVETCFNSFDVQREAAATIAAATFCGTDSLAGQPGGMTINVAGFDDPESTGLHELIDAYNDGLPRLLVYRYPASASASGKAYEAIYPNVIVSGLSGPTATPDSVAAFSATLTVNGSPTLTFM